jgi:hypothetical protein
MVDQTKVNGSSRRAEAPPRAIARSTGELLEDLLTLAELQLRLLVVDVRQGVVRLAIAAGAIVAGAILLLGCIPVALAATALCLVETTSLTLPQAFGLSLVGGIVLAGGLAAGGIMYLRRRLDILERSRAEWRENAQWFRSALRRLSRRMSRDQVCPPSTERYN